MERFQRVCKILEEGGFTTREEQLHDPVVYFRCVGFASETRGWVGTLTAGKRRSRPSTGARPGLAWPTSPRWPRRRESQIVHITR